MGKLILVIIDQESIIDSNQFEETNWAKHNGANLSKLLLWSEGSGNPEEKD